MALDWASHKLTRAAIARDLGQWVGICDEDGVPMFMAPPLVSLSAPRMRNSPASVKANFPTRAPSGVVHPIVDELVADGLGRVDTQGQLISVSNKTRFLAIERPGEVRHTYRISHTKATGPSDAPSELEVNGADMLKFLSMLPCPSAPSTWRNRWTTFTRDWAGPVGQEILFDKPRDLADMKLVTVADGATIEGPAEATIRRLISESLDAAFRVAGRSGNPPVVVDPRGSGLVSPHTLIRPTDRSIWEEVAPVAAAAGVVVSAYMWWPGDPPVPGLALNRPKVVVTVRQSEEVSQNVS